VRVAAPLHEEARTEQQRQAAESRRQRPWRELDKGVGLLCRGRSRREDDAERERTGPHHFTVCCASSAFFTPLASSVALPASG
jgi:hypothetical protein